MDGCLSISLQMCLSATNDPGLYVTEPASGYSALNLKLCNDSNNPGVLIGMFNMFVWLVMCMSVS